MVLPELIGLSLLLTYLIGLENYFPQLSEVPPQSIHYRFLAFFNKQQELTSATLRISKWIAQLCLIYFIAQELKSEWPIAINVLAIIFSVFLLLFFIELVARTLFSKISVTLRSVLTIPFTIILVVVLPFSLLYIALERAFRKIRNLEKVELIPALQFTHQDTTLESEKQKTQEEKIFQNALEFKSVKVRDCMIPRTEITCVNITASIETLRKAFVDSGHSKVLVFKETLDDVVGYCHSTSLFRKPSTIEEITTSIITVSENTSANDLLRRFIDDRKSVAVVIDQFGGTSGLVSMEDVIEEIFGDIEDEHDHDNLVEQKINDHLYLLSARLEVDYLNDTYNLNLPTGDFDTLGGLILSFTEDLPDVGTKISSPPFTFTINSMHKNRIGMVRLAIEKPVEEE